MKWFEDRDPEAWVWLIRRGIVDPPRNDYPAEDAYDCRILWYYGWGLRSEESNPEPSP